MNPFAVRDPAAALEAVADLVKSSEIDPSVRLWALHGLRAYCSGKADSLDRALGLRPGRMRRARRAERQRDLLRTALLIHEGPTRSHRIRRIAALLSSAPPEPGEEGVALFLANHRSELPRTARSLWKIAVHIPPFH